MKLWHPCNNRRRLSGQGQGGDRPFHLLSQQSWVTGRCLEVREPPGGLQEGSSLSGRGAARGGPGAPGWAILSILCPLLPNCLSLLQGPCSGTCRIVLFWSAGGGRLVAGCSGGFQSVLAQTRRWVLPVQEPKCCVTLAVAGHCGSPCPAVLGWIWVRVHPCEVHGSVCLDGERLGSCFR